MKHFFSATGRSFFVMVFLSLWACTQPPQTSAPIEREAVPPNQLGAKQPVESTGKTAISGELKSLAPEGFNTSPEELEKFYDYDPDFALKGVNTQTRYWNISSEAVQSLGLYYDLGPGAWQTRLYSKSQQEYVDHPSSASAMPLIHNLSGGDNYETFTFWVSAEENTRSAATNRLYPRRLGIGASVNWKKNVAGFSVDVSGYFNHHLITEDGKTYSTDFEKTTWRYNTLRTIVKDTQDYTFEGDPLTADQIKCKAFYSTSTSSESPLLSQAHVVRVPDDPGQALVSFDIGFTGTPDPSQTSQRGSYACIVGGAGSQGSSKITAKMNMVVKMSNTPQYHCEKDGSEWFYDTLPEVPSRFSVEDFNCISCAEDEKRDPNNPEQCIKACPEGQTSTNHGESCTTVPDPSPSPNTTWAYPLWDKPRAPDGAFGAEICQEYTTFSGQKRTSCFRCPVGSSHRFEDGVAVGCKQGSISDSFNILGFNSHRLVGGMCESVDY